MTISEFGAVYIYSICFSTIKACTYWDDSTLDAVVENAMLFHRKYPNIGTEFTSEHLPKQLTIYGANIDIVYTVRQQDILISATTKHHLENLILKNASNNTGFLLWFSDCCFACIFQHNKSGTKYCFIAYNGLLKKVRYEDCSSLNYLIDKIYQFSVKVVKCDNILYNVQFLLCSHNLSKVEKQKILRKHKSSAHKETILRKRRADYADMGPAEKKNVSRETAENIN